MGPSLANSLAMEKKKGTSPAHNDPRIGMVGLKIRALAICYAIASFLMIFLWGSGHESSRSSLPVAFLYSWLWLLAKFLSQLINPYWPSVSTWALAALLIVGTLIYLYLLSLIMRMSFRISRTAGVVIAPLFHFIGSILGLMPLSDSAIRAFDSWSFAALVLVVAYFLVSVRMLDKKVP